MESGATTPSSSAPPPENIPVTLSASPCPAPDPSRYKGLPIKTAFFFAKLLPTMHSPSPSLNQAPSTLHQGFVCLSPVTKEPPSGRRTSWFDHAPTKSASPFADSFTNVADAGENCGVQDWTRVSSVGENAMMLLCQKTVLILGRSASG